ncbi:MAG: hypothetical protein AVDCRST_MAG70-1176 [uncultured Thermomicrobiales bacterium]|uniref:Uncharacterized protein n=1 Tax=uncultured Thermomicrobiales bacterium TaxID=1645740 RepID=A0A6J4UNY0_9BACT|nr:MAG: hypothetical protein AVDCRST_MAG70-1176 [uncultured Thermomicrobiales bacterium]
MFRSRGEGDTDRAAADLASRSRGGGHRPADAVCRHRRRVTDPDEDQIASWETAESRSPEHVTHLGTEPSIRDQRLDRPAERGDGPGDGFGSREVGPAVLPEDGQDQDIDIERQWVGRLIAGGYLPRLVQRWSPQVSGVAPEWL